MKQIADKILSNPSNKKVLSYLNIQNNQAHMILPFNEIKPAFDEGLDYFMKIGVPKESKVLLENNGLIIIPSTGEIIAFQFGRFETAFKIQSPKKHIGNCAHIKSGLLSNFKLKSWRKVSLRYFSNIWGDEDTVIDIRSLGPDWALSIYFLDDMNTLIKEYYKDKNSTSPLSSR